MDKNITAVLEKRIERTVAALRKNNYDAHYIKDTDELLEKIGEYLPAGATCTMGGSMTLFETGVVDYLRQADVNFLDPAAPGADVEVIHRQAFTCDVYFTSSNAVTERGELCNMDGRSNRMSAVLFGPQKVVMVVGANKIVSDLDAAHRRIREVAGPANNLRIGTPNPCTKSGRCMDCSSDALTCVNEVVSRKQRFKDRIAVLILPESYGY